MNPLIYVAMTSRSGSSMVARVFAEHGLRYCDPRVPRDANMQWSHKYGSYYTYEHYRLKMACRHASGGVWPRGEMVDPATADLTYLRRELDDREHADIDFVKMGVEFYECFAFLAQEKRVRLDLVKVRRPPDAVAASLLRRNHLANAEGITQAVEVAKARFKLMDRLPGVNVYSDMLARGDWEASGIVAAFEVCGYQFDPAAAARAVERDKYHDSDNPA